MAFEKAKECLKKYGLDDRIMVFDVSLATVSEAACAIKCREEEIAKTLSFMVEDRPILIVVAGNLKIDNSKYKKEFHTKAKMISFDDVEKIIGHAVGGVCPFGINDNIDVYLDISLKKFEIVYPSCGAANSAVKLTISELESASNYKKWVDVCREI